MAGQEQGVFRAADKQGNKEAVNLYAPVSDSACKYYEVGNPISRVPAWWSMRLVVTYSRGRLLEERLCVAGAQANNYCHSHDCEVLSMGRAAIVFQSACMAAQRVAAHSRRWAPASAIDNAGAVARAYPNLHARDLQTKQECE